MLTEQWAHRFFELSTEPFLILGRDGVVLDANPAFGHLVGLPLESLRHIPLQQFVPAEDIASLFANVGSGGPTTLTCRWRQEAGSWRPLSWRISAPSEQEPLYCTVQALEAPAAAPPARAPAPWPVGDHLPFGLYLVELRTGRVQYANHRFCQLWGITALEGAIQRGEVTHDEVLRHCLRAAGEAAEFLRLDPASNLDLLPGLVEDEAPLSDGRTLRRLSTSSRVEGDDTHYRLFAFEDVTERKRTQEALRRSEESFRRLIDRAPEGIFVHTQRRFIYANPTLLRALGYEDEAELMAKPIWSIVHPDDLELVKDRVHSAAVKGELAPLREVRYLRRDGTWYDAESVGIPIEFDGHEAVVVMSRDITERKQAQSQLLQNDRMVLAGTLAAGVGHEINNPLTYVMANLASAMDSVSRLGAELARAGEAGPRVVPWSATLQDTEALLKEAQEGAMRVRNIVRDLKFISRQDEERREAVDVRQPLDFSINMAASQLRHRARLIKKYEPVPRVYADGSRLGQVFLNLLVNAAQAIPEGNAEEHHITVWVREGAPGTVLVDVSDSGCGMTPAVLSRVFDPFFTTKPVGKGTGLGLSICHSLIRKLGGDITVRSEVGNGTTFTVTLPTAPDAVITPAAPPAPAPRTERRGQVLVIDDEPAVGRSLARIIGMRHRVTVVNNGEDALAVLTSGAPFDAVFCDLMMPGISGMDVYERVRERGDGIAERFIFITGGSYTTRARQFLERVPNLQIEKPFDVESIHQSLGELLGVSRGSE
ncbi:hybrid sensor histidine kinase/response regulator [Myxococcus sp. Y35]|uniref:hybrid sensor histidine kinase/response regulator n=1 Tax=Pseudomyxococcus flavus TaxID=3115648 RepID=UPI003CF2E8A6